MPGYPERREDADEVARDENTGSDGLVWSVLEVLAERCGEEREERKAMMAVKQLEKCRECALQRLSDDAADISTRRRLGKCRVPPAAVPIRLPLLSSPLI